MDDQLTDPETTLARSWTAGHRGVADGEDG